MIQIYAYAIFLSLLLNTLFCQNKPK